MVHPNLDFFKVLNSAALFKNAGQTPISTNSFTYSFAFSQDNNNILRSLSGLECTQKNSLNFPRLRTPNDTSDSLDKMFSSAIYCVNHPVFTCTFFEQVVALERKAQVSTNCQRVA